MFWGGVIAISISIYHVISHIGSSMSSKYFHTRCVSLRSSWGDGGGSSATICKIRETGTCHEKISLAF